MIWIWLLEGGEVGTIARVFESASRGFARLVLNGSQGRTGIVRPPIWKVSAVQIIVVLVGYGAAYLAESWLVGSFFAGASIEAASRACFGLYAFRHTGAHQVYAVLRSLRRGQVVKYLLCSVLFGILFVVVPKVQPAAVLSGYGLFVVLGTLISARLLK
jgi:F0F1-type ATP synthase assembly protein I